MPFCVLQSVICDALFQVTGISLAAVGMITCAGCQYPSSWFIFLAGWCSLWPMVLWWVRAADESYDVHFTNCVPHKILWMRRPTKSASHKTRTAEHMKESAFSPFRVHMPGLSTPTVWLHRCRCLIRQQVTLPVSFGQRSLLDAWCPYLSRTGSSLWDCWCST